MPRKAKQHDRRRTRRRPRIMVPLTSMGDIAFLLIIFFILASEVSRDAPVRAELPESAYVDELESYPIIVAMDVEGRLFLNAQPLSGPEAIKSLLESHLAEAQTPEQRTVLFKCDAAVDRRLYEPVLWALAEAGARIALEGKLPEADE